MFSPSVSQMSKNAYSKRSMQISGGVNGCVVQGMDVCVQGDTCGCICLVCVSMDFWNIIVLWANCTSPKQTLKS